MMFLCRQLWSGAALLAGSFYLAETATAANTFSDPFGPSGPLGSWTTANTTGTFETLPYGSNAVPAPPGTGDGYYAHLQHSGGSNSPSEQTLLSGDAFGQDYTIEAYVFSKESFVAFFPTYLYFYYGSNSAFGRLSVFAGSSGISLQLAVQEGAGHYQKNWSVPQTVPAAGTWSDVRLVLQGRTATVTVDGVSAGAAADWSATVPNRSFGQFGIGQFASSGTTNAYVDGFTVSPTASSVNAAKDWNLY